MSTITTTTIASSKSRIDHKRGSTTPSVSTNLPTTKQVQVSVPSPPQPVAVTTEAQCAVAMGRLRQIKGSITQYQSQLTELRREKKHLMTAVGEFLTRTNRESVRMGDMVVQAQTTVVPAKVNILTSRTGTANQVIEELARVGVNITPAQWGTLVQHMRVTNAKTKRDVRLLSA